MAPESLDLYRCIRHLSLEKVLLLATLGLPAQRKPEVSASTTSAPLTVPVTARL